jgi:hypothetical protein
MKRFARSETHRKYVNFDILGSDSISKSDSNVRNVSASLTEQNQNVNNVKVAARRKIDYLSNYGVSNTVISGAESSLGTESKLLSQKGKNNAIQLSLPEFPLFDGEVPDEKSGHRVQSSREEEQNIPEENHVAPSPKNLELQNLSKCSTEGRPIQFRQNTADTGECNCTHSTPLRISRPKSCSDLTLSARQNCQSLTSTAYSSSPRLTAGDLPM